MLTIRRETPEDYAAVEALIRRAFYNVYQPGCYEHYLAHVMRGHADFVAPLAFVAEEDGALVGSILYTRARLAGEGGAQKEVLTFGPVCIAPERQRRGYGRQLIEHSLQAARALGYDAVVIFGNPSYYVGCGFVCCKRCGVSLEDGRHPTAMLVRELVPGALAGKRWVYRESPAMAVDEAGARRFDDALAPMEKKRLPGQEAFYILSHSFVE